MSKNRPIALTLMLLLIASMSDAQKVLHHDSLSDEQLARLEARDRLLAQLLPEPEDLQFFVDKTKTWDPGGVVRVAFQGGDATLHAKIADAARTWTLFANLELSFEDEDDFRTWTPTDEVYQAEIRITFEGCSLSSAIGMDAADPSVFPPGIASMRLGGFANELPPDWEASVLHEFGHSLGFLHEHQRPSRLCENAIRWQDDKGYNPPHEGKLTADEMGRLPGVYRVLAQPSIGWSMERVNFNLRSKPSSRAYVKGPFDRHSIMKYWFPAWMYLHGNRSNCYTQKPNSVLSRQDKIGAARLYPRGPALVLDRLEERRQFYRQLVGAPELPVDLLFTYEARLATLEARIARLREDSF